MTKWIFFLAGALLAGAAILAYLIWRFKDTYR